MKIGYLRVSSEDQNENRQIDALFPICDEMHVEKISAVAKCRPIFEAVLAKLTRDIWTTLWSNYLALDFTKLRNQPNGQRGAFEEMVCHLAERLPPSVNAVEFCHIKGDGGDGGIEAYWVNKDGFETGYQCKFHTSPGSIDWGALDRSVQSSLISHPKLQHITVAIACDLTDNVPNRRGKSAREKWRAFCTKWEKFALQQGREIYFSFWGAATIENMLARTDTRGLREYWFGEVGIDSKWFEQKFALTEAALEERYSPDDHLEVDTKLSFDGLYRRPEWTAQLKLLANTLIRSTSKPIDKLGEQFRQQFNAVEQAVDTIKNRTTDFDIPTHQAFDALWWRKTCDCIDTKAEELSRAVYSAAASEDSRSELNNVLHHVNEISSASSSLDDFLSSVEFSADQKRFSIFVGHAGTGKSHLLASEVSRAIKSDIPSIILLGAHFTGQNPLEQQIMQILDLPISFETFLDTFSAAAESKGLRGLLVIDAINESNSPGLWQNGLGALKSQILERSNLALVISCRSEHAPYCIGDTIRSDASTIEVRGFTSSEEQNRAAEVYMDRRGIRRPAMPWLSPEFSNPLFLRTTCIALESDGQDSYLHVR